MAISDEPLESVSPGRLPPADRHRAARSLPPRPALARRADLVELLDGSTGDDAEVRANLQDLARLNRLPGGTRASIGAIARLAVGTARTKVLDVGTGLGDMPLAFARRGWRTVAADSQRQVLELARAATAAERLVDIVEADCRNLPFPAGAFDVSHSSLLLHHLDPGDAVVALREMARVARRGVVINDLRRGVLPLVATGVAVALLGRCRATRVDGLTSVRRAYTLPELDELLSAAGLKVVWRSHRLMPRVVTAAAPRRGR